MLKLHLCCGDIYLKDYLNIDCRGHSAKRVKPNATTLDNYYYHPFDSEKRQRKIIVDKRMDLTKPWKFGDNTVDEIVMICALEHFTKEQAEHIVEEAYRVLKQGGKFILDTPDIRKTVEQFCNNPDLMSRLLLGTQKNKGSIHKRLYTLKSLDTLLGDYWSDMTVGGVVKHDYPMMGVTVIK